MKSEPNTYMLEPPPQEDTKPHLVWLGKFLGLDVYIDVQPVKSSKKHTELARRLFKTLTQEHN